MKVGVSQEVRDAGFRNRMKENDVSNVLHFDTMKMLLGVLKSGYNNETEYPIKAADISTLIMIDKYPGELMNFYSFRLNLENGSFTYVANKLENLGLIKMVVSPEDKRKKSLVLTVEGQREVNRLREKLNSHIEKKLDVLTNEDREDFLKSMNTIRELTLKMKNKE